MPDSGLDLAARAPAPEVERSRTHRWNDPLAAAAAGRRLGGLPWLEAIRDGRISPPPIAETLGFTLSEIEPGRAVFRFTPAEFHYNPFATVHGGVAATLIDSATGCAVQSVCPEGHGFLTIELKVNFVRPITDRAGELSCEGRVVHAGSRIATAEARLVDHAGKLYAHGSATCMIFPVAAA